VLAARLSENRKRKVLLLESGGADTDPAIPAPHGSFALGSEAFNWSDLTVPQEQLMGWANVLPLLRRVEDHKLARPRSSVRAAPCP
jgi:choline dehydrogenase-like flavoprotein